LGNVLATVSDKRLAVSGPNNTIAYYLPEVITGQLYYSFGEIMPFMNGTASTYRYGFNGKENDNEVKGVGDQQDYGMRIYDPRVGRFLSVDPISKSYPGLTPYQFASNSPIANTDLDGLEASSSVKKVIKNASGVAAVEVATQQAVKQEVSQSVVTASGKLVLHEAETKVGSSIFGLLAKSVGLTFSLVIMDAGVGTGDIPKPIVQPNNSPRIAFTPDLQPKAQAAPPNVDKDEPGVILYRGVPSVIPTSFVNAPNPAYPLALQGVAVPQDVNGTSDPVKANNGTPSIYTFWTTKPSVAKDFATNGDETHGVVLTKKFPLSVLQSNQSPDRYKEGEVQIPGIVTGATPTPVGQH
jgi:RHS repeat-associated protein